jgi:branched-chain amino acid transport system substrate-binding protein
VRTRKPLHRLVGAGVLVAAVTLTAGCGNRLPDSEFAGSESSGNSATSPGVTGTDVTAPDASGTTGGTTTTLPAAQNPAAVANPAATAAAGGGTAKTPVKGGGSTGSANTPAKSGGTAPTGGATASAACTKVLSPIVIGQTGAFSGVIGAQLGGIREGLAVWLQAVNARGGVQCHPIKRIAEDDGSDPGRAAANWNDLVKNKGAIAVLGTSEPLTTAAYRSSAERDRVPIIGGDGSSPDFWRSPYMFTQGGEALSSYNIGQRYAAKVTAGATKIGLAYCVEASICTEQKNNFPGATKAMGLEVGPIQSV